jgi:hypothetical protein
MFNVEIMRTQKKNCLLPLGQPGINKRAANFDYFSGHKQTRLDILDVRILHHPLELTASAFPREGSASCIEPCRHTGLPVIPVRPPATKKSRRSTSASGRQRRSHVPLEFPRSRPFPDASGGRSSDQRGAPRDPDVGSTDRRLIMRGSRQAFFSTIPLEGKKTQQLKYRFTDVPVTMWHAW